MIPLTDPTQASVEPPEKVTKSSNAADNFRRKPRALWVGTAGTAEPKGDMATAFGRMRGGAGEGYSWLIFPARL